MSLIGGKIAKQNTQLYAVWLWNRSGSNWHFG